MPTDTKFTPSERPRRYFSGGKHVYEQGFPDPLCVVDASNDDVSALAAKIADALNAAIENEEYPWPDGGPSVAEAGGHSILFRFRAGDLERAVYTWVHGQSGSREGWMADGEFLDEDNATSWRRMPKANVRASVV